MREEFNFMKQCYNPYLPSWEYIPDGEPHIYGDRVYVYGSHDRFNGFVYCMNDYVGWSAPVDDLSDWRYEGVIYKKTDDPLNPDGHMCLYAPDVTLGPDGRYYLYYVLDKVSIVSVAVCDTPAGKYEFYGYVKYPDGKRLGERDGDQPQFDPAVLTEGDKTYLYTGFCSYGDKTRKGAMATVLAEDMLTINEEPVFVIPSQPYSEGSGYEGYEFFEAPSIRKFNDTYYLVYSSISAHELCYATSKSPTEDFVYRGVIVSNCDKHISSYKDPYLHTYFAGNNHGGMVEIKDQMYIFYHRHTNGTNFSRQACAEKIKLCEDGTIQQAEMTSNGLGDKPLTGKGEYPAYIACNLLSKTVPNTHPMHHDSWIDGNFPKITQEGRDGDEEPGYISNMRDGCIAGFKYFDFKNTGRITIKTRGYANGLFEIKTSLNGETLASIPVRYANIWTEGSTDIHLPDGISPLYFEFKGHGGASLLSFTLE